MKVQKGLSLVLITILWSTVIGLAQNNPWKLISKGDLPPTNYDRKQVKQFQAVELDVNGIRQLLMQAPHEAESTLQESNQSLMVPLPDGQFGRYRILRYDLLETGLANRYPEMITLYGVNTEAGGGRIRIDWTERGFRAVGNTIDGNFYIEPYQRKDRTYYQSIYRKDFPFPTTPFLCQASDEISKLKGEKTEEEKAGDCRFRAYRLAIAVTGEYANYHGAFDATQSGLVLSELITLVNRVNEIYERDLGLRFLLANNTDEVFFYEADSDPYTNGQATALVQENQTTLDNVLGNEQYDLGHVLGTGGGGYAAIGVCCNGTNKAFGQTGIAKPEGDPFYVDYVAHELGHQLGAGHTFNGDGGHCAGQRSSKTAFEPGSGSTIMAYAGICDGQNVQLSTDAYFHTASIAQMASFITNRYRGDACAELLFSVNQGPSVYAGPDQILPVGTPFVLEAQASDPDDDVLTYTWEQWDNELAPANPPQPDHKKGPLFRSTPPTTAPGRYFPNLLALSLGQKSTWEILPEVERTVNFRTTVRDQQSPGCTGEDQIELQFYDQAGPFQVLAPDNSRTYQAGQVVKVEWDVAGTDLDPISCAAVSIFLSYDGGLNFPVALADQVPNNGIALVQLPAGATEAARIMVKCQDKAFFNLSPTNFSIEGGTPDFDLSGSPVIQEICQGGQSNPSFQIEVSSFADFEDLVDLQLLELPPGVEAELTSTSLVPGTGTTLTITRAGSLNSGKHPIRVMGQSADETKIVDVYLQVRKKPKAPKLMSPTNASSGQSPYPVLTWEKDTESTHYEVQLAADPLFNKTVFLASSYFNRFQTKETLSGSNNYYWRVRAINHCEPGPWSSAATFSTATCDVEMAKDLPIDIANDRKSTIVSELEIFEEGIILDLNVIDLKGTHEWIQDLTITLESPTGTQATLFDGICTSENNFFLSLDDQVKAYELPCPPIDGNTYQAGGQLSIFTGEAAAGVWKLIIDDNYIQDGGRLEQWGLQICAGAERALPVDLLEFKAHPTSAEIVLSWTTLSEITNEGFSLERKAEGSSDFYEIAWIDGQGTSLETTEYSFVDDEVKAGVPYYYRLRQVDTDGREQYSKLVVAEIPLNQTQAHWQVFPNPTSDRLTISTLVELEADYVLTIFDSRGTRLFQALGQSEIDVSHLPAGVYWLQLPLPFDKWQWERIVLIK